MSQSFAEALSWVPLSAILSQTLGRAHEYARAQSHRTVTLEHLLLALADDPDAAQVLQASNIDVGRLMGDVSAHLGHLEDRVAPGQPHDPVADEALVRILDYAAAAARQSRRREINGAIVLAAIVGEARSVAASMLQAQGLTFEGAIRALQRAPASRPQPALAGPGPMPQPATLAPVVDQPVAINGAATQTNEQILASVRRRIDANRSAAATRPAAANATAAPVREPYPAPPSAPPVRPAWEQAPLAPVTVAEPAAIAPIPTPEPTGPTSQPTYDSNYPPSPQVDPNYLLPGPSTVVQSERLPPTTGDDGLQIESTVRTRPLEATTPEAEVPPSRRPPPLPPVAAPMPTAAMVRPLGPLAEPPPSPLRPRQLGAPIVPPSSVAWPAPVQPQAAAFPPEYIPPRQPSAADRSYFDGGIAGAPYPEPEANSAPYANVPVPVQRTKVPRVQAAPVAAPIDAGQLVENIPRAMRVGRTETVEVRIARASIKGVADGMAGANSAYLHELIVTKAMSLRLLAIDGGFGIETGSPETQWLDSTPGMDADDFASWRWNVTPKRRGPGRLQLIVAARTVASDGLTADTALPEQVFDITVKANYGRFVQRAAGWIALMVLGGVLSKFGQNGLDTVATIWRGFE
jgi:neural Wiskott-Aldrich syndrome protein